MRTPFQLNETEVRHMTDFEIVSLVIAISQLMISILNQRNKK